MSDPDEPDWLKELGPELRAQQLEWQAQFRAAQASESVPGETLRRMAREFRDLHRQNARERQEWEEDLPSRVDDILGQARPE